VTLALKNAGSHKTLNSGCLGVWLLFRVLRLNFPTDDILSDIVFFGQVKHLADLRCPLRSKALGHSLVSDSGNILLALLDDDERQDRKVGIDDASTNGFALALTSTTRTVASVSFGEKETDTVGYEDTLLHRETLLVVTACNAEDLSFEFISNSVTRDFLGHALIVKAPNFTFIFNVDGLLAASGRVGDIKL